MVPSRRWERPGGVRLNAAETAAAELIVNEHGLAQVAHELGLAEITARTDLTHVYVKTSALRHAEPVAKVPALLPPMGMQSRALAGGLLQGPATDEAVQARLLPLRRSAMICQTALKALALAWALMLSTTLAAAEWTGLIVTANERDGSLSFISWPERSEVKVAVPMAPHNVQVSADGKLILAVGAAPGGAGHAAHGASGQLALVDPTAAMPVLLATIALPGHPAHVVADADSRYAFVTDADANAVVIVDLAARSISGRIPTGAYPHGLRMSPDGREIYVANMRDASVTVIDVALRKEIARIRTGRMPVQVGFTPDGRSAFVSLARENAIAIIDTSRRVVIGRRSVGRGPVQVFSSGDGKTIYVANQGREKRPDNRLSLVPVAGAARPLHIETGAGAHGVSVSDDGSLIAVTNTYAGTLSVVDAAKAKVIATIPVGRGPNGVTMLRREPRPR